MHLVIQNIYAIELGEFVRGIITESKIKRIKAKEKTVKKWLFKVKT